MKNNGLIEPMAPARPQSRNRMLLHCGAETVGRADVCAIPTPHGTMTWYPLPHSDLIREVEGQLTAAGFGITGESHALSHGGSRYFGLFEVDTPGRGERDYTWTVEIRNSHDKSFPAGLVAGSKVLVCDNLSFIGEVRISRKHTRFAARDLRHLTARAVGQLGDRFSKLDERIAAYRARRFTDPQAHDAIVKAIDCRALVPSQLPDVLHEWREPKHEEFRPRNAWSLFNACTEVFKVAAPDLVVARSQALHGLFDGLVGLN